MRLCTVATEPGTAHFAIDLGRQLLRVQAAAESFALPEKDRALISDMLTWCENLPRSEKVLRDLLRKVTENPRTLLTNPPADRKPALLDPKSVRFLPPVQRPGKILCIGLNYRDHCEEQNKPVPKTPTVFNKFTTSLIGHGEAIPLPGKRDPRTDFEGEVAFVIGKRAKNVTKRTAMKHVAGYTIMNDVSARTLQENEKQWARAKGFDGSAPMGPVIVTPDEIPDPHKLRLVTKVNGKKMQDSNTAQLVFDIPALIAFISQVITLEPGDVVSTGTPGGVGLWSSPPQFLQSGDRVEITVDRIGTLVNTCAAS